MSHISVRAPADARSCSHCSLRDIRTTTRIINSAANTIKTKNPQTAIILMNSLGLFFFPSCGSRLPIGDILGWIFSGYNPPKRQWRVRCSFV